MSATEYNDWQIYLDSGTTLERLLDAHLAQIACILSNAFKGTISRARKTKDFLLLPQAAKPTTAAGRMRAKMMALAVAQGAEIIDKRGRDD